MIWGEEQQRDWAAATTCAAQWPLEICLIAEPVRIGWSVGGVRPVGYPSGGLVLERFRMGDVTLQDS